MDKERKDEGTPENDGRDEHKPESETAWGDAWERNMKELVRQRRSRRVELPNPTSQQARLPTTPKRGPDEQASHQRNSRANK